MTVALAVQ